MCVVYQNLEGYGQNQSSLRSGDNHYWWLASLTAQVFTHSRLHSAATLLECNFFHIEFDSVSDYLCVLIASYGHVYICSSVYCPPDWPYLVFSSANNFSSVWIDMLIWLFYRQIQPLALDCSLFVCLFVFTTATLRIWWSSVWVMKRCFEWVCQRLTWYGSYNLL